MTVTVLRRIVPNVIGSIRRRRGDVVRARERLEFVQQYTFPAQALAEYQAQGQDLDSGQSDHLVAATRQWCRLLAREPQARLEQPSFAVADFWRHLTAQPREHGDLCAGAFGRAPRQPGPPVVTPPPVSAEAMGLYATYLGACADENASPPRLPLLFRVDWMLDRLDARTYMPNCGEVRYCAAAEGSICLQHLVQKPRRRPSRWGGAAAGGIGMSSSDAEGSFAGWGASGRTSGRPPRR